MALCWSGIRTGSINTVPVNQSAGPRAVSLELWAIFIILLSSRLPALDRSGLVRSALPSAMGQVDRTSMSAAPVLLVAVALQQFDLKAADRLGVAKGGLQTSHLI